MPYNDEEGHVSTAPRKSPGQPILEFVERLRPSDRNLRVDGRASQRGPALSAKGLIPPTPHLAAVQSERSSDLP